MSEFSINDLDKFDPGEEYSPFNPSLDRKFPIDSMVSQEVQQKIIAIIQQITQTNSEREHFVESMVRPYHPWILFGNSPAQKAESESIMGDLFEASVMAGQWVDIPIGGKDEQPALIKTSLGTFDLYPFRKEWGKGADRLVEVGLVEQVLDDDARAWLKPTEKLLEFFDERFTKYQLKPKS